MFDLGMGEMAVIGIVALIVVGPKELPTLFRNVGNFVGKAQGMAREFSRAMNAAAADSGVKDIKDTLNGANQMMKAASNPKAYGAQKLREAVTPTAAAEGAEGETPATDAPGSLGTPTFKPAVTPITAPITGPFAPPPRPASQGTPVPLPQGAEQPKPKAPEAPEESPRPEGETA